MKRSKIHSIVPSGRSLSALGKIVLPACGVALAATPMAHAASDTWTGATDGTWATTSNWNPSVAVPGTGDTATFNAASSNTTINLGSGVTLGTLLFDTSSAAAYTIGSGTVGSQTLTLGTLAGGVQMNSTVAANQLINANLALSTTGTYTVGLTNNSTTNTLTVAGGISASTSGAKTLTVTGAGNTSISGNITNGTGTVALTKTGAGSLTLSGANTYSSGTTISGGTLTLSGTIGGSGALTVNAGATLSGNSSGTNAIGAFAVTGASASATLTSGTYNTTGTNGNTKIDNGGSVTVSGATLNIGAGSGSFFPIGNTASTTSTVILNSGAINVTNSFGVEVGRVGTGVLTINGGTFTVQETNASALGLILGDQSTAQGGTVNLNGGTLTVRKLSSGSGSGTSYAFNFNGGTLKASTTSNAGASFLPTDTKMTVNVRDSGGTIDNNGTSITIGHTLVHSTIGGDNATDGGLTFSGTGTTTLSGANTYTGATTVNAGTLKLASTGSLTSTTFSIAAGATYDVSSLASYSLSGKTITLSLGASNTGFINAGTLAWTLGGAFTLNLTTATPGTTYNLYDSGTVSGDIASIALSGNGFSGSLVETGTGTSGVWTGTSNGYSFSLDQSTGSLTITAVPEPREFAIAISALLGALAFARSRQARRCE
jgi:autotransporter-associated beta strand protein